MKRAPSRFSTVHSKAVPTLFSSEPYVTGVRSKYLSIPAGRLAKLSSTTEQSFTPKRPVASNTTGSPEGLSSGRCTSKAITFLSLAACTMFRITWNRDTYGSVRLASDSVLAS